MIAIKKYAIKNKNKTLTTIYEANILTYTRTHKKDETFLKPIQDCVINNICQKQTHTYSLK